MDKLSKRAATKAAILFAAAKLESMDLAQVFGNDVVDQVGETLGMDIILDQAQKSAVLRIRALVEG